jgi:hypothetical protein
LELPASAGLAQLGGVGVRHHGVGDEGRPVDTESGDHGETAEVNASEGPFLHQDEWQ